MANLNLSEFGEKFFVADADHTFIWDTANAISKRVSRNSWLNSGTLTSDAPVTISQTWGTTGIYTAFKVVANETATAAAASNLLELWSGSTAALKLKVDKSGTITANRLILDQSGSFIQIPANTALNWTGTSFLRSPSVGVFSFENNTQANFFVLAAEAANTLALRNGTNAQTFRVYGTHPDTSNYARLALSCDTSGNATIATQALGSGTAGTVSINGVPVGLGGGNVSTNLAIGTGPLAANNTGNGNLAIGTSALAANTSGNQNLAIGISALAVGNLHSGSIGIGNFAIATGSGGSANIAIGFHSLRYITGSSNIAIGYYAGRLIANGSNATSSTTGIYIGYDTRPEGLSQSNQIVIGDQAIGIGSNSVVLGNDSITKTALKGNVGIGTTSPSSKLHVNGSIIQKPDTSATPATNGDLVVEATSNTLLTFKLKGTDGTVRTGTIALV